MCSGQRRLVELSTTEDKIEEWGLDWHRRLGRPRIGVALSKNGPHRGKGWRITPASPPDSQRDCNSNRSDTLQNLSNFTLSRCVRGLYAYFYARSVLLLPKALHPLPPRFDPLRTEGELFRGGMERSCGALRGFRFEHPRGLSEVTKPSEFFAIFQSF